MNFKLTTISVEETNKLAKLFANFINGRMVFLLSGNLGSGKTTFAKAFASSIGVKEIVNSPTFNIVKLYNSGKLPIVHIDAYRLENNKTDIGLEELTNSDSISLVEWPEHVKEILPKNYISILFKILDETKRELEIEANGLNEEKLLMEVKKKWATS